MVSTSAFTTQHQGSTHEFAQGSQDGAFSTVGVDREAEQGTDKAADAAQDENPNSGTTTTIPPVESSHTAATASALRSSSRHQGPVPDPAQLMVDLATSNQAGGSEAVGRKEKAADAARKKSNQRYQAVHRARDAAVSVYMFCEVYNSDY